MDGPLVYEIPEEIVNKYGPSGYEGLTDYVLETYPDIKRGDALELDIICLGRYENFVFWDGEKVIPQCHDYNEYLGAGPPLCFKTFTEFPMGHFKNAVWFHNTVYLDYDTFVDQVRNWSSKKSIYEDEDDDDNNELHIKYKGETYSLNLDEMDGNYDIPEYVQHIHSGKSTHVILVDSCNKIVDIDGYQVYYHDY